MGRLSRISVPVDELRVFFAYTVAHVPRTRKLEARSGSVQGLRREALGPDGRPDFHLLQNFRSAESRIVGLRDDK
jgi:hypothetical protein